MKILITGGSGFIGQKLTNQLENAEHEVSWLSRSQKKGDRQIFYWDPAKKEIDSKSVEWADVVIHLAGASVAGKRWTKEYKKEIYDSRIDSSKILVDAINSSSNPPQRLISASATGYYGAYDGPHEPFKESDDPADDFLAVVTKDWEAEVFKTNPETQTSVVRIGFVLANKGGALEQIVLPIKLGVGAPIGSGKQIMSWIHIDDLVNIFLTLIKDTSLGEVVNGVAPNYVNNKELTKAIAHQLKKPLFLPNVPKFALRLILGEFATFAYKGTAVSASKLEASAFEYKYPTLKEALKDLLK